MLSPNDAERPLAHAADGAAFVRDPFRPRPWRHHRPDFLLRRFLAKLLLFVILLDHRNVPSNQGLGDSQFDGRGHRKPRYQSGFPHPYQEPLVLEVADDFLTVLGRVSGPEESHPAPFLADERLRERRRASERIERRMVPEHPGSGLNPRRYERIEEERDAARDSTSYCLDVE